MQVPFNIINFPDDVYLGDFAVEDNSGKRCTVCEKGFYMETCIYDDWEGNLHCNKCGYQVKRWVKNEDV